MGRRGLNYLLINRLIFLARVQTIVFMVVDSETAFRGVATGASSTAGALFLGPVLGPPVAGGITSYFTGNMDHTMVGIAAGMTYLLASPNPGLLRSGSAKQMPQRGVK